eukprot:666851-Rhodomonas_salina.2
MCEKHVGQLDEGGLEGWGSAEAKGGGAGRERSERSCWAKRIEVQGGGEREESCRRTRKQRQDVEGKFIAEHPFRRQTFPSTYGRKPFRG